MGRKRRRKYKQKVYEYEYDKNLFIHSRYSVYNIIKKIQARFLKFLILFLNVILAKINCEKQFFFLKKNEDLSKISKKNARKLKNTTIKEILLLEIRPKSKNKKNQVDKNANKAIYQEIITNFPQMENIFDKKYIDIFNDIYLNKNCRVIDRRIDLNIYNIDKIIDLKEEKLEFYDDFIKKTEKSQKSIDKMKKAVDQYIAY